MAELTPVLGNGFLYGDTVLGNSKEYVGDANITQRFGAYLQFYSQSGSFIGDIRLDNDDTGFLKLKIKRNEREILIDVPVTVLIP